MMKPTKSDGGDLKDPPTRDPDALVPMPMSSPELQHGTMEKLGLAATPGAGESGLLYCQITGFGRTGRWDQGGFDLIAQGYAADVR